MTVHEMISAYNAGLRLVNETFDAAVREANRTYDEARLAASLVRDAANTAAEAARTAGAAAAFRAAIADEIGEITDPFGKWIIDKAAVDYPRQVLGLLPQLPLTLNQIDAAAHSGGWDYVWEDLRPKALADGVLVESPQSAARRELFDWVRRNYSLDRTTRQEIEAQLDRMVAAEVAAALAEQAKSDTTEAENTNGS